MPARTRRARRSTIRRATSAMLPASPAHPGSATRPPGSPGLPRAWTCCTSTPSRASPARRGDAAQGRAPRLQRRRRQGSRRLHGRRRQVGSTRRRRGAPRDPVRSAPFAARNAVARSTCQSASPRARRCTLTSCPRIAISAASTAMARSGNGPAVRFQRHAPTCTVRTDALREAANCPDRFNALRSVAAGMAMPLQPLHRARRGADRSA